MGMPLPQTKIMKIVVKTETIVYKNCHFYRTTYKDKSFSWSDEKEILEDYIHKEIYGFTEKTLEREYQKQNK